MKKDCLFCGYAHSTKRNTYPAYDKYCKACYERDHFEWNCPNRESKAHRQRISWNRKMSEKKKKIECHVHRPDTTLGNDKEK